MDIKAKAHVWARHDVADDWLRLGWLPLPSLDGTIHGVWSVHMVWLCECEPPSVVRCNASKVEAK